MPGQRTDREYDKFTTDGSGNTAVRVVGSISTSSTLKEQILNAEDVTETYSYTLIGGKYRLNSITYNAPSVSIQSALASYTWGDFGTPKERILTKVWSIV